MTPANAAKPLIPYLRQSRAKEHSISIEEQLRSIIRWADTHGVALAPEPVIERNVSGKKDWKERELGRAVEACQRGDAGGIIVAWQDRLSRENGLATSEVWYALQDAQARLVSTEENLDTSRGDEELNFGLRALMAREGWKRHAANWRKAKHHAWEAGIYNANAPAGYTAVAGRLVPNEHADAVREAFRAKADGGSYGAVARVLTAAGVPTSHKIKGCDDYRTVWHTASARKLLTNRAYLGEHRCSCGCDQAQADAHPPLVEPGLFLRAQRAETVRKVSRGDGEGHLLSRLVRCGSCGYRMSFDATTRRGKVYGYYRCKGNAGCPQRAIIPAGQLETWVVEQALERLGTLTHRTAAVDLTPLRDAVANTEAEVAEVEAAADELSPVAYGRALTRAQAALEEAQLALAEAEAEAGGMFMVWSPDEVRRIFTDNMPIPARREVLTQMIGEVTVRPAQKTEVAERASIGWADVESWREAEAVTA